MPLTPELRDSITSELKRIGADLNLSDDQKQKVQAFMTEASEKLQEYKQQNPNASKEDLIRRVAENRTAIRQRLVSLPDTRPAHKMGFRSSQGQGVPGAETRSLTAR